jgi:Virulence factor membrane-bound polymerase, C-terminal/Protein glycosylation ligase/O-Antigen ligase
MALALSWLIPNHHQPWLTFHSQALMAIGMLGAALWLLLGGIRTVLWPGLSVLLVVLAVVPWYQYHIGLISTSGLAWVTSTYLLAMSMAIVMGKDAQLYKPDRLIHVLLGAIAVASLLSVALQTLQWLGLYASDRTSWLGILVFSIAKGARPNANLGQPNILATLLIWGLLSLLWFYANALLKKWALLVCGAIICLGLVLTQSRIGFVELCALSMLSIFARRLWPKKQDAYLLLFASFFCVALYFAIPVLGRWLAIPIDWRDIQQLAVHGDRVAIWRSALHLIALHPYQGYGWSHLVLAFMQGETSGYIAHAHNIVLDLALWAGVPICAFVVMYTCFSATKMAKSIHDLRALILFFFLIALTLHALVELPHMHSFFLLPACVIYGALCAMQSASAQSIRVPRVVFPIGIAVLAISLGIFVKEYFTAENLFFARRFEHAKIGQSLAHETPPMFALNQLEYMLVMLQMQPRADYTQEDIAWMNKAVRGEASPVTHLTYIGVLALNGEKEKAVEWMRMLNRADNNPAHQRYWRNLQEQYPAIKDVAWQR